MRLATYNLLHGRHLGAGGRVDLAAVADALAGLEADVLAVQEVDRGLERTGGVDQLAWLADRLGWHGAFAPALLGDPERRWTSPDSADPGGPAYGIGLLSRTPLSSVTRLGLPGGGNGRRRRPATPRNPGWDREPRVALRAIVERDGRALAVATVHLSYLPWRGFAQLRAAARFAAAAPAPAAVLLGDLNLPAAAVRRSIRSWEHRAPGPSYPSWEPKMRPDQVLLRGVRATAAWVGEQTTSDHLPVLVELAPWSSS